MAMNNQYFQLFYQNKHILDIEYTETTNIIEINSKISNSLKIDRKLITTSYNNKLIDSDEMLKSILKSDYSQIHNSKVKLKIVPEITLNQTTIEFSFKQISSDSSIILKFDIFDNVSNFKNKILNHFKKIFLDLNQELKDLNFYNSTENEEELENLKNDSQTLNSVFPFKSQQTFYYMVKYMSICFFTELNTKHELEEIEGPYRNKREEVVSPVGRFKLPNKNEKFKIIIQTYNKVIKEISVFNEMSIGELKDIVEEKFSVSKSYQDLSYLFFKLDDDFKTISDYLMKKGSIVYLRGFYFPIIFCDYYTKKKQKININIATIVNEISQVIKEKFCLDDVNEDLVLTCNGKSLDNEKFLIEYNIQKFQTIYFK